MSELSLSVSKVINAPIEKVFDAWLNAKTLAQFMLPAPGMPEPRAEVDAREGGRFTVYIEEDGKEITLSGIYLKIDRPNTLKFSWESFCAHDKSEVMLSLNALDAHTTNIQLHHIRFIDESSRKDHEGGWSNILQALADKVPELQAA